MEPASRMAERGGRAAENWSIRDVRFQFSYISVRLHPLLLLPVGSGATTSEEMIAMSEIEEARQSLEIKLQRIRESLEPR